MEMLKSSNQSSTNHILPPSSLHILEETPSPSATPSPSSLSPMATHFLVVFILAAINALLALIYGYIRYTARKRNSSYRSSFGFLDTGGAAAAGPGGGGSSRRSSDQGVNQTRRKTSTHIVLSLGHSKDHARRISNAFL